jgi:hypothetical protein
MAMTTIPKDDLLDNARRHVREGADRVARQEAIVVRLERIGAVALAEQAAEILSTLNTSLRLAREDFAQHNSSFGDAPSTTLLGSSGS